MARMKKIPLISLLILLFTIEAFGRQADSGNTPPNVLFIIADDLNATLNSYGKEEAITPNLDKLAQSGIKFEKAYSQAPLCNPSRASVMTGKRPHHLGIWNNDPHFRGIFPNIKTITQYFKSHGYHSIGIGKIFHNWGQTIEGDPKSWSYPQQFHWAAHYQDWYIPGRPYELHKDIDKGPAVQKVDVPDVAYLDGRIANEVIMKLREFRESPFFMAVGFWKPHLPYNAPEKYWNLYNHNDLPEVKYSDKVDGVPQIAYVDSDEARSYTDVRDEDEIPESKKQELRHGYLAAISYLDGQVGKLINELEKLGMRDNTIIVFISDHGYHAGEHGQFGKWTNFEVGVRTPLIISAPGIGNEDKTSKSIVELIDLYPTLLELCNLPQPDDPERLDGISLVPVLKNTDVQIKSAAFSQIARPLGGVDDLEIIGSSIRSEKFRYNMWADKATGEIVAEELYDLSEELYNANNLIGNFQYKRIQDKLSKRLKNLIEN